MQQSLVMSKDSKFSTLKTSSGVPQTEDYVQNFFLDNTVSAFRLNQFWKPI